MTCISGPGKNKNTPHKEDGFRKFIRQHIAIWNIMQGFSFYTYIDGTAGPGIYPDGIKGSPFIFLEECKKQRVPYHAHFIEKDLETLTKLRKNVVGSNYTHVTLLYGDSRYVVPEIFSSNKNLTGLLYFDANGLPDFEGIINMNGVMKRMDLLLCVPTTMIKRIYHWKQKRMSEYLDPIDKKFWVVNDIYSRDPWGKMFFYGSNSNCLKPMKHLGWWPMDSCPGQDIMKKADYPKVERKVWF